MPPLRRSMGKWVMSIRRQLDGLSTRTDIIKRAVSLDERRQETITRLTNSLDRMMVIFENMQIHGTNVHGCVVQVKGQMVGEMIGPRVQWDSKAIAAYNELAITEHIPLSLALQYVDRLFTLTEEVDTTQNHGSAYQEELRDALTLIRSWLETQSGISPVA